MQQQHKHPQQQQQPANKGWKKPKWTQQEWDDWRKEKAAANAGASSKDSKDGAKDDRNEEQDVQAKAKTDQLRGSVQKLHQLKTVWDELPPYLAEPLKAYWQGQRTELQESKPPDTRHKLHVKKISDQKIKIGKQEKKLEADNQAAVEALETAKASRESLAKSVEVLSQFEAELPALAEAAGAVATEQPKPTPQPSAAVHLESLFKMVQHSPEVQAAMEVLARAAAAGEAQAESPGAPATDVAGEQVGQDETMQDPPGEVEASGAATTEDVSNATSAVSDDKLEALKEEFLRVQAEAALAAAKAAQWRAENEALKAQLEGSRQASVPTKPDSSPGAGTRGRSSESANQSNRSRSSSRRRKAADTKAANSTAKGRSSEISR